MNWVAAEGARFTLGARQAICVSITFHPWAPGRDTTGVINSDHVEQRPFDNTSFYRGVPNASRANCSAFTNLLGSAQTSDVTRTLATSSELASRSIGYWNRLKAWKSNGRNGNR